MELQDQTVVLFLLQRFSSILFMKEPKQGYMKEKRNSDEYDNDLAFWPPKNDFFLNFCYNYNFIQMKNKKFNLKFKVRLHSNHESVFSRKFIV
jgi:hypothetical protein